MRRKLQIKRLVGIMKDIPCGDYSVMVIDFIEEVLNGVIIPYKNNRGGRKLNVSMVNSIKSDFQPEATTMFIVANMGNGTFMQVDGHHQTAAIMELYHDEGEDKLTRAQEEGILSIRVIPKDLMLSVYIKCNTGGGHTPSDTLKNDDFSFGKIYAQFVEQFSLDSRKLFNTGGFTFAVGRLIHLNDCVRTGLLSWDDVDSNVLRNLRGDAKKALILDHVPFELAHTDKLKAAIDEYLAFRARVKSKIGDIKMEALGYSTWFLHFVVDRMRTKRLLRPTVNVIANRCVSKFRVVNDKLDGITGKSSESAELAIEKVVELIGK